MPDLYDTLSTVRTSLLNAVGTRYINGTHVDIDKIVVEAVELLEQHDDFMEDLLRLDENQLHDLGCRYLNRVAGDFLMLIPIWLYAVIPSGTRLIDINGDEFIHGDDLPSIYATHWLDIGFMYKYLREYIDL